MSERAEFPDKHSAAEILVNRLRAIIERIEAGDESAAPATYHDRWRRNWDPTGASPRAVRRAQEKVDDAHQALRGGDPKVAVAALKEAIHILLT